MKKIKYPKLNTSKIVGPGGWHALTLAQAIPLKPIKATDVAPTVGNIITLIRAKEAMDAGAEVYRDQYGQEFSRKQMQRASNNPRSWFAKDWCKEVVRRAKTIPIQRAPFLITIACDDQTQAFHFKHWRQHVHEFGEAWANARLIYFGRVLRERNRGKDGHVGKGNSVGNFAGIVSVGVLQTAKAKGRAAQRHTDLIMLAEHVRQTRVEALKWAMRADGVKSSMVPLEKALMPFLRRTPIEEARFQQMSKYRRDGKARRKAAEAAKADAAKADAPQPPN